MFTLVINLNVVIRQKKVTINDWDSDELKQEKQDQNDYIEMLNGIHDYI